MATGSVNEFLEILRRAGSAHVKVQTAWARAAKVDWEERRMDALGVKDNLPFEGVLLGIGSVCKKPAIGSLCLIGLIENRDAAAFLIDAEEIEEMVIVSKKFELKNETVGLKELFQDLKQLIFQLKVATPAGPSVGLLPDSITALEIFETKFNQLLN